MLKIKDIDLIYGLVCVGVRFEVSSEVLSYFGCCCLRVFRIFMVVLGLFWVFGFKDKLS